MALLRLDNIAIVVDDLDAAVAYFSEIGLEEQDQADIEGRMRIRPWASTVSAVRSS